MSERYRITVSYGNDSVTFKTKTRVGEFWNFAEEMKEHTDWENMAIAFSQLNSEILEVTGCPECKARTQSTHMEGQYLVPPSDKAGIVTACTKCDWVKVDRL